jgi:hypothetical protein
MPVIRKAIMFAFGATALGLLALAGFAAVVAGELVLTLALVAMAVVCVIIIWKFPTGR